MKNSNRPFAFDDKTGVVYQLNEKGDGWDNLGTADSIPPDIKYTQKAVDDKTKKEYGLNRFTNQWEETPADDWIDKLPVPKSVERGVRRASLVDDNILNALGLSSDEDFAAEIARVEKKIAEEPMTKKQAEGIRKIYESKSFPEFAENIVKNPHAVGVLVGESLGAMSGAGATALGLTGVGRLAKAAPWTLRVLGGTGLGLGSGATEATNTFIDNLKDEGVDTFNEESVVKALQNTDLVNKLRMKGALKGVPVGVFDGLSGALGGKTFGAIAGMGPKIAINASEGVVDAGKLTAGRVLGASAGETAVQASMGAAGEALGQIASEGSITSPVDVYLEATLEGVMALPQAAVSTTLASPVGDMNMPSLRDMFGGPRGEAFVIDEEVVGEAKAAKEEQRKIKKPLTDQIVDSDTVAGLSGFTSLVEAIQPDELKILRDDIALTGDLETDAVNAFNKGSTFRNLVEGIQPADQRINYQRAFHGTPHKFDQFSTEAIGTGEGAQAFGWGLYFTDNKSIADWYKKELSSNLIPPLDSIISGSVKISSLNVDTDIKDLLIKIKDDSYTNSEGDIEYSDSAIKNISRLDTLLSSKGSTLEVEIPNDENLLQNETPITEQPKTVKDAIRRDPDMRAIGVSDDVGNLNPKLSGRDLYFRLQQRLGSDKAASKKLSELGIKGLKYRANQLVGRDSSSHNFVVWDDSAIEIASVEYQRLMDQKQQELTTSSIFDINQPWDLAYKNLRGLDLKNASPELKKFMGEVRNKIRTIAGDKVAVDFYDTLREFRTDSVSNPVRGAQWLNNIAVAMDVVSGKNIDPFETAMHETWHYVRNTDGFFSERDKNILEQQRGRILNYVQEQTGLSQYDIEQMAPTKDGLDELEAWAFGLWSSNKLKNSKYTPSGFTPMLNQVFDKALKFIRSLGDLFRSRDFNDIFEDVDSGRTASEVKDQGVINNQEIRWQKIAQGAQAVHQNNETKRAYNAPNAMREAQKHDNSELGPIGSWGRYVSSLAHLGSISKFMGQVYDNFRVRESSANSVTKRIDAPLKASGYHSLSREKKDALGNLADFMRKTKQRGKLDADGHLTFERDGKIVRVKDVELSKQYMALQDSYRIALKEVIDNMKYYWQKHFDLPDNFTKDDVIAKLQNSKNPEPYQNILESLDAFEKLQKADYVPRVRFGDFGFVVKDTQGNTVAFYTVERGSYKGRYNKIQMEEIQKNLMDKYGDTNRYKIYGDKGQITNLSNLDTLSPFGLTQNEASKHIDNSMVSLELLAGLINSRDLDVDTFSKLQEDLYSKISKTGFAKHMLESQDIDGYSTDWARSQYAYQQGLANYIGNLTIRDNLTALKKILEEGPGGWKDKNLYEAAKSYVNYMSSPQEEYMKMRAFNFLWVMGANMSSAMLQVFTLPTLTFGNLMKFNHNPLSNAAAMNKYWWVVPRYFGKKLHLADNTVFIPFSDEASLTQLVKDGVFTSKRQADFNKWMAENNSFGALLTEEYAGRKQYETRDFQGKLKASLSSMANFLGVPISVAEQATRFASANAAFEQLSKLPNAEQTIMEVLGNDQRFAVQVQNRPEIGIIEHASLFIMDEAHSVMGRVARAPYQRGLGGAVVFPFQGYPQNAIESMIRMWGQGKQGKIALASTLGAFMVFSGLIGLPGAELLKELYEAAVKATTGEELDLDFELKKALHAYTGSDTLGKFVAQGVLRSHGGMDFSKRIGASIPGQDVLLALTGVRGEPQDLLGVQGSLLSQIAQLWYNYNTDAGLGATVASMSPVALANILRAAEYADEGVYTSKRQKLVDAKDLSGFDVTLRALGITSGRVADYRERNFYSKVLETKFTPFVNTQREKAKNHLTRAFKFENEGKHDKAMKEFAEFDNVVDKVRQKVIDEEYPIDVNAFVRSAFQGALQREYPEEMFTRNLRKAARPHSDYISEVLGVR